MLAAIALGAAIAQIATPPPQMSALQYFAGRWACSGTYAGNGNPAGAALTFSYDVAYAVLVGHREDSPGLGNVYSLELWSYSSDSQRYVATLVDRSGAARTFTSPGWDGDVLTWTGTAAKPPQRFVYTRKTAEVFQLDWQTATGPTSYVNALTMTCTKQHFRDGV